MKSWPGVCLLVVICLVTAECSPKAKDGGAARPVNGIGVGRDLRPRAPTVTSLQLLFKDGQYVIPNFRIGTPGQTFTAALTTTSSYSWVYPSGCSGCPTENSLGYNHDVSESFEPVGDGGQAAVPFETRFITGNFSRDLINLAGMVVQSQWFLERDGKTPGNVEMPRASLGLAFDDASNLGAVPYLVNLAQSGVNPMFCLSLNGKNGPSWLDLGGANSNHYKGSFTYIHVTNTSNWGFKIDSVLTSGHPKDQISMDVNAFIDITTDYIYGPIEDISRMYEWIGVTQGPGGRPKVPCNKAANLPNFYFMIGEDAKVLTPCEYIEKSTTVEVRFGGKVLELVERCTPMFKGMDGNGWRLGTTFIKHNYVQFDAGKGLIGYAASYF